MRIIQAGAIMAVLACPAAADTLIVCNKTESTLSFVDLETGREIVRRKTSRSPHEIALSPDGTRAVVVSYIEPGYVGEELNLFDVATATLAKTIQISPHKAPHGIEWIGDSTDIIATTEKSHDVIKVDIDSGKVIASLVTGTGGPHLMALSPDDRSAYVTDRDANAVFVVDVPEMTLSRTLKADEAPEGVDVSPDGETLWVGNNDSRTIIVFDTKTGERIADIDAAYVPIRIRFTPDGNAVAVADLKGGRIVIYDPSTRGQLATVDLTSAAANSPASLLFSPDGTRLYVGAQNTAQVVEIDTRGWTISRTFSVGEGADSMAITTVDVIP